MAAAGGGQSGGSSVLPAIQSAGAIAGGAAQLGKPGPAIGLPSYKPTQGQQVDLREFLQIPQVRPELGQQQSLYIPQAGGANADLNLLDLFSKLSGRQG